MQTRGIKDGWYRNCLGEKTYPVQLLWDQTNSDLQRLEFLLTGYKVSSTCAGDQFFVHPFTGYFSTPRLAVDCAMDILRQKKWRCYEPDCMETATHRISCSGTSFKKCAEHAQTYIGLPLRWSVEDLTACP